MANLQQIDLGTAAANGSDGDTQRVANQKTNDNMDELEKRTTDNATLAANALPKSGGILTNNVFFYNANMSEQFSPCTQFQPEISHVNEYYVRNQAYSYDADSIAYRIEVNGANGINRYHLKDDGNATAPGSWNSSSDERLKTNIVPLYNSLETIRNIGTYSFTLGNNIQIGYIAQELLNYVPQLVKKENGLLETREDGTKVYIKDKDGNNLKEFYTLNYGGMSAVNSDAIKQLDAIVSQQAQMINDLKSRLDALENA